MHIGIITGEYPPMEGGIGDYTRELSSALAHLGHQIHILTSSSKLDRITNENKLQVNYSVEKWTALRLYPAIQRWLRDASPDVVNIQYEAAAYQMKGGMNLLSKWLSISNGPPTIVTYHDLLPPYLFPKAGFLRDWSVRYLAENANGVIVTNEADKNILDISLGHKCPPLKLIPIGSNIATQTSKNFHRNVWRANYGISEHDLLIGFFGFMNRSKGVDVLVSAIKRLYNTGLPVKLLFIGGRTGTSDITNSEYADYIDSQIKKEGISDIVHRTGFVSPQEVSASLHSIDICALPYLEGASLRHGTLHAALNHGCAIITTKSSQVNPKLENGSVRLIPPDDTSALAEAIVDIWENQQQRMELQIKALDLSKSFGWENIAEETATFFHQCQR